ncbi:MAG TPA: hypothetical protein VK766_10020 [Cytophagaceae bacterium]|jgi:hypothetical protein|nr:hypothetical protein [Cytophagaceae bacterium]
MKTKAPFLVIFLIISSLFVACKKYEDGPKFITLRSVKNRLTNGNWTLDQLTIGGTDSTQFYDSLGFNYNFAKIVGGTSDGSSYSYTQNFTYQGQLVPVYGNVYFTDHGNNIQMVIDNYNYTYGQNPFPAVFYSASTGSAPIWKIIKLTEEDFWLQTNYNGLPFVLKLTKVKK